MQSIQTKYLPATNARGSRIKATCDRGSITIPYPHDLSGDARHVAAADALVARFEKEDAAKYGTHKNPWSAPRVCGGLPDGTVAHVYVGIEARDTTSIIQFADKSDKDAVENFAAQSRALGGTPGGLICGLAAAALARAKGI